MTLIHQNKQTAPAAALSGVLFSSSAISGISGGGIFGAIISGISFIWMHICMSMHMRQRQLNS